MDVRLIAETQTTVTFGWDQVPGARGFRYTRPDGKRSHTWDGATVSAKFAKMDGVYLIEPLSIDEIGQGVYPPVVTPPPPPPTGLPFAEAQLRPGFQTVTIPNAQTPSYTTPAGSDVLIDLEWIERPQTLKIYVRGGQRVHVKNGWFNSTYPPSNSRNLSPYWRGGPGFRMLAGQSSGAEHCSLTDCLITGPYLTDGFTVGSAGDPEIQKVTVQRTRIESASLVTNQLSDEPAEHTDAVQVQGPCARFEFGQCTFYTNHLTPGHDPGKCFMLNDYANVDYVVDCNRCNFRDVKGQPGGTSGGGGAFIIQDIRQIAVNFTDCYGLVEKSAGGSYQWQSGSSLFMFYGSSYQWTSSGTAPNRVASFPAGSGFTGTVKEGKSPSGDDYCTRTLLGV